MATYGEIRHRVLKEVPGVDLTLIDGYLCDRYTAILDKLRWNRQKTQYVFETTAPYSAGTLTLTSGATSVTLADGTFTSGMTGLALVVGGRNEWYTFTYASGTTGTLDRPFTGDTASTYTFSLVKSLYTLPATTRLWENAQLLDTDTPLEFQTRSQMNQSLASRPWLIGCPAIVAPAFDSASSPPQIQIELSPAPDKVYSVAVDLVSEASTSLGAAPATSTALLPWLRPACLAAFAQADAFAHLKDWPSSQYWKAQGNEYLADMARTENAQAGPLQMSLSSYYTAHRRRRGCR